MIKKITFSIFLFIMLLILVSCCEKSLHDLYYNINDIDLKNTYNFRNISEGVTVNQQGYRIKCFLNDKTVKEISDLNKLSVSYGHCEDNFIGLDKDISNLSIRCNQDILNTLAGTSLDNNNIRFYENIFGEDSENIRMTVQEWLTFVNNEDQLITFEWYIEFNEPIVSNEFLKFQLTFELEDGTEYITETESVKFE